MSPVITSHQDFYYQYSDGRDLLSAAVLKREHFLQEIEALAKAPQGKNRAEIITRFEITRAQTILYELSMLGDIIESLIVEINSYAERSGMPRVEII
jgi:hypothetical protein